MSTCHLIILSILLIINYSKEETVPVYTPNNNDQQPIKIYQDLDAKSKSSDDNLQSAGILVPFVTVNSNDNQTFTQKSNENNKIRKVHKHQTNRSNKPKERKNQPDSLAYNLDQLKRNQLTELNNGLILQLLAKQKSANINQDLSDNKYNQLLPSIANNNEFPLQFVPIYTTESPSVNNLFNNDPNQLAFQIYLRRLAQLAQLQNQKTLLEKSAIEKQEKPRLQKRVSSNQPLTSSSSNLQLANLNQYLQNQQPVYTLVQPQPQSSSQALYLALQQPYSVMSSSSTTNNNQPQQQSNGQVNSLIETGDRIFAKIKQWSTDVLNPKSSLNRQISEVLTVVSDVALVALVAVPVLGLASLGFTQLMGPLGQATRKSDRNKSSTKQKVTKSEEKKDSNSSKDEKTAKSDSTNHMSQKNTKSLDKKSRLVSLIERAGDEFNHFKNLVEIAKNLELAFKKYNVEEKECKYRILCEIGSGNEQQKANETNPEQYNVSNNLLRESKELKRQVRSIKQDRKEQGIYENRNIILELPVNLKKEIDCNQKNSNCSINNIQKNSNLPVNQTSNSISQNEFTTVLYERNRHTSQVGGSNVQTSLRNAFRNFNMDKFLKENREGLTRIASFVNQWANKLRRSNDDHLGELIRSDKLIKTISEKSKQLEIKLKGFLENLTEFQEIVAKDNLDMNNKVKSKLFNYYTLRSKRETNLNIANETISSDQSSELNQDDRNLDVSGLKFVLNELINQLKQEQTQDNLILPLTKIWLSPFLNAHEFGMKHTPNECKARYFKCSTNFIGLNNGNFARRLDLEIISNSHLKQALRKKPLFATGGNKTD